VISTISDIRIFGYIEEEYFINGKANIYKTGKGFTPEILYRGADYCNRILIRKPTNPQKSSGRIIIEILNPSAGFDIDRMWVLARKHFMENGDIYIGITSKPDVIEALMAFDKARYSEISWKSPLLHTNSVPFNLDQTMPALPDPNPENETGLFWDMLTGLAKLLRTSSGTNPVSSHVAKRIYLTGWSQSVCYLIRYVKSFSYRFETSESPLFDGYLAAGAVHKLLIPLNQEEYALPFKPEDTTIPFVREPYIALQTESENAAFGASGVRQEDSDDPDFLYRIYDIPDPSHDTKSTLLDYYDKDDAIERIGLKPKYCGEHTFPNDYPYGFVFHAAFHNLYTWAEKGVAPPHANKIPVDKQGRNMTDILGNAIGGVRTPFIDYPTCQYHSSSSYEGGVNPLFGYIEPFSPDKLKSLYSSLYEYRKIVINCVNNQIKMGFLLESDAADIIDLAVRTAENRGLSD
jgi:hypothetical protein